MCSILYLLWHLLWGRVRKAPSFTLTSLEGQEVSLDDFTGKVVVLEWFNPGCPYVKYIQQYGFVENSTSDLFPIILFQKNTPSESSTKRLILFGYRLILDILESKVQIFLTTKQRWKNGRSNTPFY